MGPVRHEHTDTLHKHPRAHVYSTCTHTLAPVCMASPNYRAEWFDCQRTCSWLPQCFHLLLLCTAKIVCAYVCVCVYVRECAWKVHVQTRLRHHRSFIIPWTLMSGSRFLLVPTVARILLCSSLRSFYGQRVTRWAGVHFCHLALIFTDQCKLLKPWSDQRSLIYNVPHGDAEAKYACVMWGCNDCPDQQFWFITSVFFFVLFSCRGRGSV